jgi:hypothetical protein
VTSGRVYVLVKGRASDLFVSQVRYPVLRARARHLSWPCSMAPLHYQPLKRIGQDDPELVGRSFWNVGGESCEKTATEIIGTMLTVAVLSTALCSLHRRGWRRHLCSWSGYQPCQHRRRLYPVSQQSDT